jgi:hypothetical protein
MGWALRWPPTYLVKFGLTDQLRQLADTGNQYARSGAGQLLTRTGRGEEALALLQRFGSRKDEWFMPGWPTARPAGSLCRAQNPGRLRHARFRASPPSARAEDPSPFAERLLRFGLDASGRTNRREHPQDPELRAAHAVMIRDAAIAGAGVRVRRRDRAAGGGADGVAALVVVQYRTGIWARTTTSG